MSKKKPSTSKRSAARRAVKENAPDLAPTGYADLLSAIKQRVQSAQVRAAVAVNRELIRVLPARV